MTRAARWTLDERIDWAKKHALQKVRGGGFIGGYDARDGQVVVSEPGRAPLGSDYFYVFPGGLHGQMADPEDVELDEPSVAGRYPTPSERLVAPEPAWKRQGFKTKEAYNAYYGFEESCNCENLACHHDGPCPVPAGEVQAIYVGPICDDCASRMPKEYLKPPHGTG